MGDLKWVCYNVVIIFTLGKYTYDYIHTVVSIVRGKRLLLIILLVVIPGKVHKVGNYRNHNIKFCFGATELEYLDKCKLTCY